MTGEVCLPIEKPVMKGLPEYTTVEDCVEQFKIRAITYLYKTGDRIPTQHSFTITMVREEIDKYDKFVMSVTLEQIQKWRSELFE